MSDEKRAKTGAERQAAYAARMKGAGFKRLSVWVPVERKADFDRAVGRLQDQWYEDNLYPSAD